MLAVLLALGSGLAWGVADFLGGLTSRRIHVLTVILLSQAAGLIVVTVVVAIRGEPPPGGDFAWYAAGSAIAGCAGLGAFYRGMAIGAMSVVTPISATAAALPVAVGLASGDRPSGLQAAGMALALVGVVLAAREPPPPGEARPAVAAGAGLALAAALGFGCFFLAIDAASDGDVLWAILVNRITGVLLLCSVALLLRPRLAAARPHLRALAAIGVLDMSANLLFAVASTKGLVSLVSVLGSLYPVTVIFLAHLILGERIAPSQRAGVATVLAGVVLISGG